MLSLASKDPGRLGSRRRMHFGARAFGSSDGFPVHTPMGQMLSIEILGLGKR